MDFQIEVQKRYTHIVGKAWADEEFKRRLIADPKAVLREEGIEIPDDVEVRVVENTEKVFYLSLPPKPSEEVSDEELERISGGLFDRLRELW